MYLVILITHSLYLLGLLGWVRYWFQWRMVACLHSHDLLTVSFRVVTMPQSIIIIIIIIKQASKQGKMKIFSLAFFVTPECHTPLQCQRSMNSNLSFRAISRTKVSKLLPLYPILMILYPILTILLSQLHQFNTSFDRIVNH